LRRPLPPLRPPARLQGHRPLLSARGREEEAGLPRVSAVGVRGRTPDAARPARPGARRADAGAVDARAGAVIRRAMVLAAGFGTRLRPLTLTVPKALVPVADKPFVEHLLALLHAGGIREVVINLHHLGDVIERHLGDGSRFGLAIRYSPDPTILDPGGGIKRAEMLRAGEPFVVANADSLLQVSLREVWEFHRAHGGIATLALRADPDAARYGLVEVDRSDRVRRIVGLPEGAN